ncbi:MAG: CheA signal transduction histidine kinase [Candidatus Angelobacter sp.]|nr:CheA signal transduction histidine kinase [Candidatus Angelobacter sp.]
MNFFSDDHAAELRELFFETATELLQALNEEGLELEKRPEDEEVLRQVRRTVHTLKGDSAACGYTELSELAHALEDALRPDVAALSKSALAEVVLIAADTFSSMLSAYRGNLQAPAGEELKQQIVSLTRKPSVNVRYKLQARFVWSEYEQMVVADALGRGETVYHVAFSIEPQCPMRGAAMQLIRNVLQDCGKLLAIAPDQSTLNNDLDVVEAAVASENSEQWITKKCRIPSVVAEVLVQKAESPREQAEDVLDIVKHITAPQADETEISIRAEERPAAQVDSARVNVEPQVENAPGPGDAQSASFASMSETLLRVDAEKIDSVLNLVGELIIAKSMLHQAINEFDRRYPKDPLKMRFSDAMAFQARIMNDLQKSVMKIRMVPVEHLFRRFPRVVRDVAKSCGKEVNLVVTGQDTDLDKSILDMLAEPLAHLVRNAVDHGIESPAERINDGKPAHGTVRLEAYHQGNEIVIEVSDDGRGIARDRLVAKAVERGLLKPGDASVMGDADINNLIFHPGLSTAQEITSISGRGVGMDVVKTVLEKLKGTVSIRSTEGKGTTFLLKVPLTLAIIKALLFRVGDRLYAVPLASVVEITRTTQGALHRVDQHEVMQLRNEVLTLLHLHRLERDQTEAGKMFVVVISTGERKFGLVVDHLVGEEELVIKAIDDHLVATDLVSGASILGDGTVVLILNLSSVVAKLGKLQMVGATA